MILVVMAVAVRRAYFSRAFRGRGISGCRLGSRRCSAVLVFWVRCRVRIVEGVGGIERWGGVRGFGFGLFLFDVFYFWGRGFLIYS